MSAKRDNRIAVLSQSWWWFTGGDTVLPTDGGDLKHFACQDHADSTSQRSTSAFASQSPGINCNFDMPLRDQRGTSVRVASIKFS
jgi:hypothetical protein